METGNGDGKHNWKSWRGRVGIKIPKIESHGQQEYEGNQPSNHCFPTNNAFYYLHEMY